jgi:nucleotide-binding universal stress UspA family protein
VILMPMTEICSGTRLERILLATDFSSVAEVATAYAVGLARQFSSLLEAVHVIDLSSADPTLDVLMEPTLEALRHSGQERLQHLTEGISGLTLKKKMIEGHRTAAVLLGEAIDGNADLIVLGTSSKHGLQKLTLGSTAEEVVREAPCPVLTIGPHVSKPTDGSLCFRRIVFATDFSACSAKAATLALSFAKESDTKVYLCHVVGDERTAEEEPLNKASLTSFKELMNGSAEGHCPIEFVVEHGEVAGAVLGLAAWVDADLIIMGARKASFWRTYIREGFTPAVLAEAGCPVLTVC